MSRTDENQRQEDFKSNWRWDKNQDEKNKTYCYSSNNNVANFLTRTVGARDNRIPS